MFADFHPKCPGTTAPAEFVCYPCTPLRYLSLLFQQAVVHPSNKVRCRLSGALSHGVCHAPDRGKIHLRAQSGIALVNAGANAPILGHIGRPVTIIVVIQIIHRVIHVQTDIHFPRSLQIRSMQDSLLYSGAWPQRRSFYWPVSEQALLMASRKPFAAAPGCPAVKPYVC